MTPLFLHRQLKPRYRQRIMPPSEVPPTEVAVVFGAGLRRDGTPTLVLRDRIATAADLYFAGKVEKLLLTGGSVMNYNEPESMRCFALSLGLPDGALMLDDGGRSTYDSCYRARAIFGLSDAVLVTQAFHLVRALYLCDAFGINAVGVPADRRFYGYDVELWWKAREMAALTAAWWKLNFARPEKQT